MYVLGGGQPLLNKGFTLIELLAVLIVLAIIAVIAVPIVLNIIKETKEKSYDISVENIMRSAKIYDLESELNDTTILMDQNIYDDLKNNLNGSIPDDGVVYLKSSITGEKREIAFALQYGEWCYTKAYGDPTYEKKKSDTCEVPFDYLIKGEYLYNATDNLFFDNKYGITREQIESIITVASSKVPSGYENKSWDVSQDKTGKVMAWYEDIDKNGLYEVYIGQNGGVKANKDSQSLFAYLTSVKELDLTYFDTTQVTNMTSMFGWCSSLTNLDLTSFSTQNVTSMNSMFRNCSQLENLNLGNNFNTGSVTGSGFERMFQDCFLLESLDVSNWDLSGATNLYLMFKNCEKLSKLDVSNWNMGNITSFSNMFYGCSSLKELNVSKWNTSQVTNMQNMFYGCEALDSLDVSNFDISKIGTDQKKEGNIKSMFHGCSSLTSLDLSKWDTSGLTSIHGLFEGCIGLTSLNVSNWDTSRITSMSSIFDSVKLTTLDLSDWDTSSVTTMDSMFRRTSNLTTIKIGCGWKTAETTTNIFSASKYTLDKLNTLVEEKQATCPTS